MITAQNTQQLNAALANLQGSVALVTTMGNLHQGHLSLVERAKQEADNVVVTIYVNPLQFSATEDLSSYPRTLEDDIQALTELNVDLLFTPSDEIIYPLGMESHTQVVVPGISDQYCGANRKGHFRGVTTVVCKLFNLIRPNVAIFGNKDFQQLTIIRTMVADLAMNIRLIGIETYREDSGLAMSSRNRYLSEHELLQAKALYETLCWAEQQLMTMDKDFTTIESTAIAKLEALSFEVEYFSICNKTNLNPAHSNDQQLVVLTAAKFGHPRLIDNIIIDLSNS